VASIEIKTRVATERERERVAHAEKIIAKFQHKLITYNIDDDT
jgi:hypothetical protein